MFQQTHNIQQQPTAVGALGVDARATFIQRTYSHLLGAIVAFTLFEMLLFKMGWAESIARAMLSVSWLFILGGFMLVGFIASRFAFSGGSIAKQYVGLTLYVVVEGLIFVPLLFIADLNAPGVIGSAALTTLVGFSALTAIVFVTRKDFSFLRTVLVWASFAALGFIVAGVLFGFSGGVIFPILMIALAGGWILYDTSNVMLHFPEDRYVGASLQLFASVALMFWYVLLLFMSRD